MKKLLISLISAGLLVSLAAPISVAAQTSASELKKVEELVAQIKAIQEQILGLQQKQVELNQSVQTSLVQIAQGLRQGSQGDQVKVLQTLLALDAALYPEGLVTGYFGPATRRAIERFQRKNNLEAVGFVGPKTKNLLEKLLKEAEKIDDDDDDDDNDDLTEDIQEELAKFFNSSSSGNCAIPSFPFGSTIGSTKIVGNGNVLMYKDGKHKIIITPNSYHEKDGKKKLLITPGLYFEKDGKIKTKFNCGGNASTTPSGNDTTAPIISSVQSSPTYQSAVVSWITNEAATGKVYFGTTSPVTATSSTSLSNTFLQTGHSFTLTGLSPSTVYYFKVESKDAKGNTATSSQLSFTTSSAPDVSAPSISALSFSTGTSTATITWTTNETSTSKVYYSTTSPLNTSTASVKTDASLVTSHSVTLTGLTPGATYYFKAESADAAANTALSSETSFTTSLLPADVTAPVISAVGITPLSTTAAISWTTNELATSRVYFGTVSPLATSSATSIFDGTLVTSHNATLTGLTASTTYYIIVESKDAANNTASGSQVSFTTTN